MRECVASNWGVRELKRQIDTRLYERLLHTQEAKALEGVDYSERALTVLRDLGGIKDAETNVAMSPFKDPYVFEFADIPRNQHVLATDLESVLIDSLEEFLLELGRGFSFVKRQRHLSDNGEDWWVDLVFYNYYLRRFVLFDLKTGKLDPRDVGQMDFYLNFFDDKYKLPRRRSLHRHLAVLREGRSRGEVLCPCPQRQPSRGAVFHLSSDGGGARRGTQAQSCRVRGATLTRTARVGRRAQPSYAQVKLAINFLSL
jgi:predicted nuclease of restriction endonuclease-like (RecB) superfamily